MITAGEVLKNKRESLGKNLNTVSADTKIQKRFLEYIENDQYEKFDSEVFASGFIKIYSRYLGLDVEKLLAVYRRSNLQNGKKETKTPLVKKERKRGLKFNITPQLIAIVALVVFLLSVVGYIGFQIYKFQTPPQLTVLEPINGYESKVENILVKGSTDAGSTVTINDLPVELDSLGYFEKEITLNEGLNNITVISKKNSNNSLESSQTIKVLYNTEIPEEISEEEVTKEYKVVLKITGASAWIKLDIDGENKVAQILEPNTSKEFTVINELILVTGRISATTLEINGEALEITSSQNSGVGQITCQIIQNALECK
jgi:cytoskeletal protein RodZ